MAFFRDFRTSTSFAIIVVTYAFFADTLLHSLVIPLLPAILSKRVGIEHAHLETWISIMLGSYGAASLLSPSIVGPLTDRLQSKKMPFTIGLLVLIAGTIMFFHGKHVAVLLVGRLLHGVSTTMVLTSGMTFLNLRLGGKHGGSAIGVAMTGSAVGDLVGPAIGGFTYDACGEFGVFTVAAAAVVVDIILRMLMMDPPPESEDPKSEPLLAEQRRVQDQNQNEASPAGEQEAESGSRNSIVSTVHDEEKSGFRLLLTNVRFIASLSALCIGTCAQAGLETTVPLFISRTFIWSEGRAGLVLLLMSAPNFLSTSFARLKPRWPTTIAFLVMGLFYIALGFATDNTILAKVMFLMLIFGIGFCLFLITTVHMTAVSAIASEVERKDGDDDPSERDTTSSGKAFALMNQALAAGRLVGPMWAGPMDNRFGWLIMCVSFSGVCILTSGFVVFTWRVK